MTSPSSSRSKRRRLQTPALTDTPSLDQLLQSALYLPDPSLSIALSLDRILDATPLPSDKTLLLSSATRLASALLDAATRSTRKLAASHNSSAWPLSTDLTIKVFSMLDSESVCVAAAACSLFSRCASDSLCYADIDLTRSVGNVTNTVVSTMIQRAGKNLRSIKLGRLPQNIDGLDENENEDEDEDDYEPPLTGSCLAALTLDGGAAGLLLQRLHLYNIKMKDYDPCLALSACKSLSELEIVGIEMCYESVLTTLIEHCHSIECLTFDIRANDEYCTIKDLRTIFPLLTSLSLRGFRIADDALAALVKGACCLRYLDLSTSFGFSGRFLRDLSDDGRTNLLETFILCDCRSLIANEVFFFLSAALCGNWKALRYVDISNRRGLLDHIGPDLTRSAIQVSHFIQGRPDIHLVAVYPPDICFFSDACDGISWPSSSSDDDSDSPSSSAQSGSLSEASSSGDDDVDADD